MKKLLAKLLVICVCTIIVTQGIDSQIIYAAPVETTAVQIDWKNVVSETTPFSYGLNAFAIWNPAESSTTGYNNNMDYMNPGLLRLHSWEMMRDSVDSVRGWIDYDNMTWDEDKILASLSGLTSINPNMVMNIPGWPSWMDMDDDEYLDVDKFDDYADFCAELVRIVNVVGGFDVEFWEPTNERDDIYFVRFVNKLEDGSTELKDPNVPDRLDELISIYNQCAKKMKEVDPTIKTGGLAFARQDLTEQVRRLIQGTKNETNPTTLDFLTYHFYASGDAYATYETIYNRIKSFDGSNSLSTHTKDLQDILNEEGVDIPMWMDECNIFWSWDINADKMHTHQAAVYDALSFIYAHQNGAEGIAAWNEKDGAYGKFDDDYNLRPSAHVYQLFNNYMVGSVVETSTSAENKVVSFAVKNGEDRSFVIVNRTDNVQAVTTNFTKDNHFVGSAKMHQTSEAGYHMYSEDWNNVINNTYRVPANSVTLFTNSGTNPTIIPDPIEEKEVSEVPNFSLVLEDEYKPAYHSSFEGNVDWLHFGSQSNPTNVDRKVGVSSLDQISYNRFGTSELNSTNFWFSTSWSNGDGAPLAELNDSNEGVRTSEINDGYEFHLPANANLRQAYIYWGSYQAKAKIEVQMSDGSITPYEGYCDTTTSWGAQFLTKMLYKTETENAYLIVRITLLEKYQEDGDMMLKGVTINNLEPSPGVLTIREDGIGGVVDLTSEGPLDWAFWGGDGLVNGIPSFEHKVGVPSLISNVSVVSGSSLMIGDWTVGNSSEFGWSDGTTAVTGSAIKTLVSYNGGGKGLEFTVPAGTEAKTLKVYGGVLGCSARLEVSLYDSNGQLLAPPINKQIRNSGWVLNVEETIQFKATEDGSTLKVRYLFNGNDWGNSVWLSAAALSSADVTPPTAPANVATEQVGTTSAVVTWDSSIDDVGVSGYNIYIGDTVVATVDTSTTSYFLQGLIPATAYQVTVKAYDAQGNTSIGNNSIDIQTTTDLIAPTAVGNLRITNKTNNSLSLAWNESIDNVKLKEYYVACGNTVVVTSDTHYTFSDLDGGKYYDVSVCAFDTTGNYSEYKRIRELIGQLIPVVTVLEKQNMYIGGTIGNTANVNSILPNELLTPGVKLSYTSSDNLVVTVNATGEITAKGVGTAKITITNEMADGLIQIYEVPVSVVKAYVEFTTSKVTLTKGKKYNYTIIAYGYDTMDVTWLTEMKKVAEVSKNKGRICATVTAKSIGEDFVVIKVKDIEVLRLAVKVIATEK